ncbi:MAG: lipopolysaccharide biosynthesis protein [Sulfuricaulis sp.]
MRLTKSHLKELSWIAAGQVATFVGGVAGIKVLTSLLDPGQYGILALALTFATLSQQAWSGPLQQAVNRNVAPFMQTGRLPVLIATGTFVYLRMAVGQGIILSCGILSAGFFLHLSVDLQAALLLGVLLAAIQPAFELPQGVYVQLRQRRMVAIFQGVAALVRPMAAAVLIINCGANAVWAMMGMLIAMLAMAGAQGRQMISLARGGEHSKDIGWSLVRFAAPYLAWGTLSWGVTAGDRWILGATNSAEVVGLYVVAIQVSTIVPRLASQMISSFVLPILNEIAGFGTEEHKIRRAMFVNSLIIAGVGALGVIGALIMGMFGMPLLALLAGPSYDSVAFALPWLFAGSAMYEVAYLCFNIGPLLYRPQAFMIPRMAAYGVTLCLMGLFTVCWGLDGMVAAYVIGATIQLGATAFTAVRLYKDAIISGKQ